VVGSPWESYHCMLASRPLHEGLVEVGWVGQAKALWSYSGRFIDSFIPNPKDTHTYKEREREREKESVFPRWEKDNPAIYVIKKRRIKFTNSFEIGEQKSCFQPNNQDPFDHFLSCPPPAMIPNASSRIKYENQGP
jgi:hypothetical protein